MTTRAAGTTDRASARRLARLAQVSVRTRLAAVIALLTLVTMTASGVLVWTLESARIDAGVREQIDQEVDEFRVFQRQGFDPETGTGFTDALQLVTVFLAPIHVGSFPGARSGWAPASFGRVPHWWAGVKRP